MLRTLRPPGSQLCGPSERLGTNMIPAAFGLQGSRLGALPWGQQLLPGYTASLGPWPLCIPSCPRSSILGPHHSVLSDPLCPFAGSGSVVGNPGQLVTYGLSPLLYWPGPHPHAFLGSWAGTGGAL